MNEVISAAKAKQIADDVNNNTLSSVIEEINKDICSNSGYGKTQLNYYGAKHVDKKKAKQHLIAMGYKVEITDDQRDGWTMKILWGTNGFI